MLYLNSSTEILTVLMFQSVLLVIKLVPDIISLNFSVHSLHDGSHITTLSDDSTEYITCMACLKAVVMTGNEGTVLSSDSSVLRLVTGGNNAELKVWDMTSQEILSSRYLQLLVFCFVQLNPF